jgi:enoyl-CoA hydratase/carnithine racemase
MSAAGTEASHPGISVGPTSDFSKPIFAVNGTAYGGGSELAQSTDFILATESATFGQPGAMLGLASGRFTRPAAAPPAPREGTPDADDR